MTSFTSLNDLFKNYFEITFGVLTFEKTEIKKTAESLSSQESKSSGDNKLIRSPLMANIPMNFWNWMKSFLEVLEKYSKKRIYLMSIFMQLKSLKTPMSEI